MTLTRAIPDEAPPPYTPNDPLTPSSSNISTADTPAVDSEPVYSPSVAPANFISAAGYFDERALPRLPPPAEGILEHALTIYTRSKVKDHSRFPRCWRSRAEDISKHDWNTFLNHLFPIHLGPASAQPNLPPQLRAEIQRDQKDRPQETDAERKDRIAAVVSEWNECFFVPRGVAVIYCYASEDGMATAASPLCPRCYPSSARSIPLRQRSQNNSHPTAATAAGFTSPQAPEPTLTDIANPLQRRAGTSQHDGRGAETCNGWTHGTMGGLSSSGVNGPATPVHSWTNYCANQAEWFGKQLDAHGRLISEKAGAHGKAIGQRAQWFGRMAAERAEARGKAIEQHIKRSGYEPSQTCWGHARYSYSGQPHWIGDRGRWNVHVGGQRRHSVSSYSSSSLSTSDDDSLSTISSDSMWEIDALENFRNEVHNIRERHDQHGGLISRHQIDAAGVRREFLALRAAHQQLHNSCKARGPIRRKPSKEQRRTVKEEMRNAKREYRSLARQIKSEMKSMRQEQKKQRKEERRAAKAAKIEARRRKNRQNRNGEQDAASQLETGIVHININDPAGDTTETGPSQIPIGTFSGRAATVSIPPIAPVQPVQPVQPIQPIQPIQPVQPARAPSRAPADQSRTNTVSPVPGSDRPEMMRGYTDFGRGNCGRRGARHSHRHGHPLHASLSKQSK